MRKLPSCIGQPFLDLKEYYKKKEEQFSSLNLSKEEIQERMEVIELRKLFEVIGDFVNEFDTLRQKVTRGEIRKFDETRKSLSRALFLAEDLFDTLEGRTAQSPSTPSKEPTAPSGGLASKDELHNFWKDL